MLARLLAAISHLKTDGLFDCGVVVVDNDATRSAEEVTQEFAARAGFPVTYHVQPTPNIAMTRNMALANAHGEYLAFIDDDEFPAEDWLLNLLKVCQKFSVAGVLGPVLPHFETKPPAWLEKGGFYDRPRHPTGFKLGWQESRTGNVLIRKTVTEELDPPFQPEFGAGGEDQDFFRRLMAKGHSFIWCDEAPAYETVPSHRWKRRFLFQRAFLRGKTTHLHGQHRLRNISKSIVAIPAYALALPFLSIVGHHAFMKYLVKMCDHLGRILAAINLNPVKERNN